MASDDTEKGFLESAHKALDTFEGRPAGWAVRARYWRNNNQVCDSEGDQRLMVVGECRDVADAQRIVDRLNESPVAELCEALEGLLDETWSSRRGWLCRPDNTCGKCPPCKAEAALRKARSELPKRKARE